VAVKYAILGLLSWRPCSGYDMKKALADSSALYWSGNSNQVYPTLIQLHKDGLVTAEVEQAGGYPPRKVYSITADGVAQLKSWVISAPELPQLRSSFLTQLAWADLLSDPELTSLLDAYEHEVSMRLLMQRERVRRNPAAPRRTPRETYLWDMIAAHDTTHYEHELSWLAELRDGLGLPTPSVDA
jgi:PadR family transcriptional regulator, regulatory protein AphA